MRLTHYGHACVLLELPQRVLIDPGGYSIGFEHLTGLDLVLITHSHADHLDVDRLRYLLESSPQATVVHSPGAAHVLAGMNTTVAEPGDELSIAGVGITVTGSGVHACIHPDLAVSDNNGYLLNGAVLHPGDALDPVDGPVDVLLVPAGGPWMKIREGIDYLRAVSPRVAVPIHQAGLAPVHQRLHQQLLANLAPRGTKVVVVDHAVPQEL
ncbi:MBL fold metallo-hydrolase [Lentzea sp. PSKA42]|jgi:L-ascorbate metabolism protein UlaG (beta-lactamase superfamily)|uniref:MBL fold metallo-hydrolase n=1 Tax=Lentzea indica TaxID=2604800 RepID=A0ABX1FQW2_9PSEU|nr:MBL fold metallo-hydrolase [Lentzea indica]NKE61403.1 MBL fold metallo-hydrolase [Lentzea indica]